MLVPPPRQDHPQPCPPEPDPPQSATTGERIPEVGENDESSPGAQTSRPQADTAELVAAIEKKIADLVDRQRERTRLETRVRGVPELNHITKYAVNIAKDQKPRDTITYLRRTDITPVKGSKRSSEMAELARDYHNDLQADGGDVEPALRFQAKNEALNSLPPLGTNVNMTPLDEKLSEEDVLLALLEAAPGKAAGMDGFATEFWNLAPDSKP
ncbi:hypothetical protein GGX14DRAFT_565539 [Mycena pura]|uniref:Uncharacterized protein n=1 Tax=Mycena pura TaxID=153505 RepID=A0AAD6VE83_9AGAR|nr:hypothetical protein GGX14DRAFT_565539 [Mycena pura]